MIDYESESSLDVGCRVGHPGAMLQTANEAATAPKPLDAGRYAAVGVPLTQRRVVDFGLVNSACCR
ncbi:hypothetical protein DVK44_07655 [Streptomyces paludis]|uniref:Uncharacterized protein n=1 Tax=Streptomyces paludis TaxID=2282738 RepID=A0A345HLL8_9ACTN|nr:hypothetical protein DVK44_07655 [Streptomyces paludis]